jgi:hypothetical protein
MCTRTAAWENDKENADDHMYNQQYSAHPQQKWQSRLQSVVLRDQLYRLPVFLWVHFGDFSLTQHRNRRNHPPTYLAEPHSRAHSRTFAASFWRFSQGHEHYSALTLVRRVLNSASQCERSRQAIEREREGKPASSTFAFPTPAFGQPLDLDLHSTSSSTRSVATFLLLYNCRPAALSSTIRRLIRSPSHL